MSIIKSPHGECPSCKGPLTAITYSCGSPKDSGWQDKGSCLLAHHGFECVECSKIYEKAFRLEEVTNAVNVGRA